jgi:hypothetical protein
MEELPHIWRHISPFEVFGGKDTLFRGLFYIFGGKLFAMRRCQTQCGIVDMIKPSKERHFLMKMTSGIIDPFYALKGKRSKMSHIGGAQSMTCGKV